MSLEKEFEGQTVTDAAIEACKELGIPRDELKFEVVQEESSGVLGIGSRNAIIKVLLGYYNNIKHEDIPHLEIDLGTVIKLTPNSKNYSVEKINLDQI